MRGLGLPLVPEPSPATRGRISLDPVSDDTAHRVLQCRIEEGAPPRSQVLVDFCSAQCGPCVLLEAALLELVDEARARWGLQVVKADVSRNARLVRLMAEAGAPLQSLPCVALFQDGVPVAWDEHARSVEQVRGFVCGEVESGSGAGWG